MNVVQPQNVQSPKYVLLLDPILFFKKALKIHYTHFLDLKTRHICIFCHFSWCFCSKAAFNQKRNEHMNLCPWTFTYTSSLSRENVVWKWVRVNMQVVACHLYIFNHSMHRHYHSMALGICCTYFLYWVKGKLLSLKKHLQ